MIFDQLKKSDPHLRFLAALFAAGISVLLTGLWWVQIVTSRNYRENLETQSFRTIRVPAARGEILDRNRIPLAENRPVYSICLYLEELRKEFDAAGQKEVRGIRAELASRMAAEEQRLGRELTPEERQRFKLTRKQIDQIYERARCNVVSNIVARISQCIRRPLSFNPEHFTRHYERERVLPYPVAENITAPEIARFEERSEIFTGVDIETQAIRVYPHKDTAAHVLGYLRFNDESMEGEEAFFWYRLPDYRGVLGVEYAADRFLHGRAGVKSVLINHLGFRQSENIWSPAIPGSNVVLTIDLHVQKAVEKVLDEAPLGYRPARAAAVVMDVHTGDVLALASSPDFDPNAFARRISEAEYRHLQSIGAEKNRATQVHYRPGSIFKTLVGLACLEAGLDEHALYQVQPYSRNPRYGGIVVGREFRDTVSPGLYDFRRAFIRSSNAYFIAHGLPHLNRILALGRRLHLGELTYLANVEDNTPGVALDDEWQALAGTRQEVPGSFPDEQTLRSGWSRGETALLCFGQGRLDVTPLQMTVLACALANGGKVLYPRLIDSVEPMDPLLGRTRLVMPKGRVRDHLGVSQRSLKIIRDAMRDDVADNEGTARFARIDGFQICAKTGTAQNERGGVIDTSVQTTWILSFAPYEDPRYAVVVMAEGGLSGGETCGPMVKKIYEALLERERMGSAATLARSY